MHRDADSRKEEHRGNTAQLQPTIEPTSRRASLAAKYDGHYANGEPRPIDPFTGWPRNRNQAITSVPGQGRTLLDIGCGNGEVLYQMRYRYETLIGIEISPVRLEKASQLLAGCSFQSVLATGDTFSSISTATVDRALSSDVIEHTVDVYSHLREIFRVLRPGGDLVMNTPNTAFITRRLQLLVGRFPTTSYGANIKSDTALFDGGHLHYFTFPLLCLLLRQTGFEIIRKMGFGRFGRIHNMWPELLSSSAQIHARKPPVDSMPRQQQDT